MTTLSVSESKKMISMPRMFLHLEGLVILSVSLILYASQGFSWLVFALLLLTPDLSFIFYLMNKRVGSIAYNLVHTILFPVILGLSSYYFSYDLGVQLALIWFAHIGMDRSVGYGFKYTGRAKETHFSRI